MKICQDPKDPENTRVGFRKSMKAWNKHTCFQRRVVFYRWKRGKKRHTTRFHLESLQFAESEKQLKLQKLLEQLVFQRVLICFDASTISRPDGRPRRQNLYEAERAALWGRVHLHTHGNVRVYPPMPLSPAKFKAVFFGVVKPIIVPAISGPNIPY